MSRKKKNPPSTEPKPDATFKNSGLASALGDWKSRQPSPRPATPAPPSKKPPSPQSPVPKRSRAELDAEAEDAFFLRAMGEVEPVEKTPRVESATERSVREKARADDARSLAELAELVAEGEGVIAVRGGGVARGAQAELVQTLARGDFPVEATLDLPGLTPDALLAFLTHARREGLRCVRASVDATRLGEWTSRAPFSRMVLAYSAGDDFSLLLLRR